MPNRMPLTIITGFLGAGKTTLLSNLIKETGSLNFAIIINEFGEVSIDGTTLKRNQRHGVEIYEVSNGLVAYAADDQFSEALQSIIARQEHFDYAILETSGLAVPTLVLEAMRGPELNARFAVDATITVVDTPMLLSGNFYPDNAAPKLNSTADHNYANAAGNVFIQQLRCSDVVVLNKVDSLTEDEILVAEEKVRNMAPLVRFVEVAYKAKLDQRVALGLRLNQPVSNSAGIASNPVAHIHAHSDGHTHSGLSPHEHGINSHTHLHEHDPSWLSFALHSRDLQDQSCLQNALTSLTADEPILRLKGTVNAGNCLIAVQGVRRHIVFDVLGTGASYTHEHTHEHAHEHTHEHKKRYDNSIDSEIVFIGYDLSREHVASTLSRLTNTKWA